MDVPGPVLVLALRGDDVQLGRPVERRVERIALAQRRGQRDRLEGAAGRTVALGREVELHPAAAREVVDHRLHGAGARVDRDERRRGIGGRAKHGADRVESEPLQARVERRPRPEAAELHLPLAQLFRQLLRRPAEEVRLVELRVEMTGPQQKRLLLRVAKLRRGDVAVLPHRPQHLVPAGERGVGIEDRVIGRRRLRQAGEQRGLHERELRGALREIRLRGRFGAVGVPSIEDLVEVVGEDRLPRQLLEDLLREASLLDLARQRPLVVPDVEVADELLGDRRAALDDVPLRDVLVESPGDALVVERAVLPEPCIFDRHRRLGEPGRDLCERQRLPVRGRRDDAEQAHAVRVEERVLAELERAKVGEAAGREQDLAAREGGGRDRERDERSEDDR